jgi:hypothetical protein
LTTVSTCFRKETLRQLAEQKEDEGWLISKSLLGVIDYITLLSLPPQKVQVEKKSKPRERKKSGARSFCQPIVSSTSHFV